MGIWFCPESPRWLVGKGRDEEARVVLAKLHANGDLDHPLVLLEMTEMRRTVEETGLLSWRNFFDLRKLFNFLRALLQAAPTLPKLPEHEAHCFMSRFLRHVNAWVIPNARGIHTSTRHITSRKERHQLAQAAVGLAKDSITFISRPPSTALEDLLSAAATRKSQGKRDS